MSKIVKLFSDYSLQNTYILTASNLAVSLLYTLFVGVILMYIYKHCHDTLTYNKKFSMALMMLAFISTILLALIQNNPLLSLGVLGSLSICRIRTNTKDPRDLGFVFWAISIGISSAIGAFLIGIIGTFLLGCIMIGAYHFENRAKSLLLVVRGDKDKLQEVQDIVNTTKGSTIQSKNIFSDSFEVVYELKGCEQQKEEKILSMFEGIDGLKDVNILAPETKVA